MSDITVEVTLAVQPITVSVNLIPDTSDFARRSLMLSEIDQYFAKTEEAELASQGNVTAVNVHQRRGGVLDLTESTTITMSGTPKAQMSSQFFINANPSSYTVAVSEGTIVSGDLADIATMTGSQECEITWSYNGNRYLWRVLIIDVE